MNCSFLLCTRFKVLAWFMNSPCRYRAKFLILPCFLIIFRPSWIIICRLQSFNQKHWQDCTEHLDDNPTHLERHVYKGMMERNEVTKYKRTCNLWYFFNCLLINHATHEMDGSAKMRRYVTLRKHFWASSFLFPWRVFCLPFYLYWILSPPVQPLGKGMTNGFTNGAMNGISAENPLLGKRQKMNKNNSE